MSKNVTQSNFLVGNYSVAMVIYLLFSVFSFIFVIRIYWVIKLFRFEDKRITKVKQTLFLISIISMFYFIQAIYGFFAIIGENKIDEWSRDKFINEDKIYYIFVFIWLTITEIIPCLIIWVVFHLTLNRTKQTLYAPIENENDEI
ncbi:hypothetical protein M0812_15821 [Anaeramoeba flamelloides]|uniref:Uncharacterized protein n=1 Tax=Anaeramoeba flamelloides TaxID=1746091 RepID=A0AAV7ZFV4_9EUKA|nr:hypothetical protein M0812_15821 [Anaeramoeba flamelloides]